MNFLSVCTICTYQEEIIFIDQAKNFISNQQLILQGFTLFYQPADSLWCVRLHFQTVYGEDTFPAH